MPHARCRLPGAFVFAPKERENASGAGHRGQGAQAIETKYPREAAQRQVGCLTSQLQPSGHPTGPQLPCMNCNDGGGAPQQWVADRWSACEGWLSPSHSSATQQAKSPHGRPVVSVTLLSHATSQVTACEGWLSLPHSSTMQQAQVTASGKSDFCCPRGSPRLWRDRRRPGLPSAATSQHTVAPHHVYRNQLASPAFAPTQTTAIASARCALRKRHQRAAGRPPGASCDSALPAAGRSWASR